MTDQTNQTNPAPPVPNPMNGGVNPYPRPADGSVNWPLARAVEAFIASLPVGVAPGLPVGVVSGDLNADNLDDPDPNAWLQEAWRCKTGMCYAGWTGALTGATFPYAADDFDYDSPTAGGGRGWSSVRRSEIIRDANGKTWKISTYAKHMLGLSPSQADALFAAHNKLDDISEILEDIKDGNAI